MQIAIDFGNTLAKAALFEGEKMIDLLNGVDYFKLIQFANDNPSAKIMMCSVNQEATHVINLIENKDRIIALNHTTTIPIINAYQTPETLGMDRLAAVVGANYLFKNENCLVIDAGTCVTFDFVDAKAVYWGGLISPGLLMRFKSLQHFTSKLPLIELDKNIQIDLIGTNSKEAIMYGVCSGILNEINLTIDQFKLRYGELKILLCGGDHTFFESRIKHSIFAYPELVLLGLNRILLQNVH